MKMSVLIPVGTRIIRAQSFKKVLLEVSNLRTYLGVSTFFLLKVFDMDYVTHTHLKKSHFSSSKNSSKLMLNVPVQKVKPQLL